MVPIELFPIIPLKSEVARQLDVSRVEGGEDSVLACGAEVGASGFFVDEEALEAYA